ncbi:MAG: RluA family pseudouridine synthase [Planctomycetota bacterium]|nr:RluA family pseudouridine synthase [Planctomycetota bacterium]
MTRIVSPSEDGTRLDQFLAVQPEVGSRGRAKDLIAAGKVAVEEAKVRAGLSLRAGQQVRFEPEPVVPVNPLKADDSPPPALRVLFEDAWLIVIDKPAGLITHPPEDRQFRAHTVASAALAQFGELPTLGGEDRPGIVHRLDRDTSGVMVLARNDEADRFLRAQFRARTVKKEYRCIAYGESRFQSDWIDRAIATDPRRPERMAVTKEGGRESTTYYEVVERFQGFTHFLCRPESGRTHQIRVHMTSVGHSLVGDRVYRSRRIQTDGLPESAPNPGRQCLHAFRLSLQHPCTHEVLEFEAPLAEDLKDLLRWLRAERPAGAPG